MSGVPPWSQEQCPCDVADGRELEWRAEIIAPIILVDGCVDSSLHGCANIRPAYFLHEESKAESDTCLSALQTKVGLTNMEETNFSNIIFLYLS